MPKVGKKVLDQILVPGPECMGRGVLVPWCMGSCERSGTNLVLSVWGLIPPSLSHSITEGYLMHFSFYVFFFSLQQFYNLVYR